MVEPSVWGPPFWSTVHYVALGYPSNPTPQQAADYKTFFLTLGRVLPCSTCRENFQAHLKDLPAIDEQLANTGTLFAWTVALHNEVNKDAGKPVYDVESARAYYLQRALPHTTVGSPPSTMASSAAPGQQQLPCRGAKMEGGNVLIAVLVGIACALGTLLVALILLRWWYSRLS